MPPTRAGAAAAAGRAVSSSRRLETPGTVNFDAAAAALLHDRRRQRQPQPPRAVRGADSGSAARAVEARRKKWTSTIRPIAIALTWPAQPEDIASAPVADRVRRLRQVQPARRAVAPAHAAAPVRTVDAPVDRETDGTVELYADLETEARRMCSSALSPASQPAPSRSRRRRRRRLRHRGSATTSMKRRARVRRLQQCTRCAPAHCAPDAPRTYAPSAPVAPIAP